MRTASVLVSIASASGLALACGAFGDAADTPAPSAIADGGDGTDAGADDASANDASADGGGGVGFCTVHPNVKLCDDFNDQKLPRMPPWTELETTGVSNATLKIASRTNGDPFLEVTLPTIGTGSEGASFLRRDIGTTTETVTFSLSLRVPSIATTDYVEIANLYGPGTASAGLVLEGGVLKAYVDGANSVSLGAPPTAVFKRFQAELTAQTFTVKDGMGTMLAFIPYANGPFADMRFALGLAYSKSAVAGGTIAIDDVLLDY